MDAGGSEDSGVQDCTSIDSQSTRSASTLRGSSISAQSQTSDRRDNGPTHTVLPGQQSRLTQARASLDSGFRSASSRSTIQGHSAFASTTLNGAERTREWIQSSNFEVQVQDLKGKTYTVETNSEENVDVFRKKVAQRTGTAVNNITTVEGKTLENGTKMGYNGIKRGQRLYCSDLSVGG